MKCSIMPAAVVALSLSLTIKAAPSPAATAQPEAGTSQGVVVLETEGSAGISVRVAEELGRVVNDGSRQRIVPVIGTGSLQNIAGLRLLDRCCYPSEGCARLRKAAEPRSPYRIVDDLHYHPV
jgi:hypothetical protein